MSTRKIRSSPSAPRTNSGLASQSMDTDIASASELSSLNELRAEISGMLSDGTARDFMNTTNHIMRLGGRKPKLFEARREKLRDIVARNTQIVAPYNAYAALQMRAERRLTYRLPAFPELEMNESKRGKLENREAITEAGGTRESDEPAGPQQSISVPATALHSSEPLEPSLSSHSCDQHTNTNSSLISVHNPEDFPIQRIQEVQSQHYPSTKILTIGLHAVGGVVTQVTADVEGGSIDHLLIKDVRLISALGVREGLQDTLSLRQSELRIDETFTIKILPRQPPNNPKAWVVGELVSARHAYLYWLDSRQSADPKAPPFRQEVISLANQLGRRWTDVWREVKNMWDLEQGNNGRHWRENREKYLGESPSYPDGEEKRPARSMW